MGQRKNSAAAMVARTKPSKEECAFDMVQRSKDAASKDAQMASSMEECALGMGQRSNNAAAMDAQTAPSREEFAKGTGNVAMTNQLHLIYHVDQHVMRQRQQLFKIITQLQLREFKTQVAFLLARSFAKLSIMLKSKEHATVLWNFCVSLSVLTVYKRAL